MTGEGEPGRGTPTAKPLVLYDGECGLCAGNLKWLHRLDWLRVFDDQPYQRYEPAPDGDGAAGGRPRRPAIPRAALEQALHVVFPDGTVRRGADALRSVFLRLPLTFLLALPLFLPPIAWLLRKLYPLIARNRHRLGGSCELPPER